MKSSHPPRKTITTNDGARLSVIDVGSGRPFLILPAWSNSAAEYHAQIQDFANDHRVVAIDMRSHGESEKLDRGHRISRYAADLRCVLESLDLQETTMMGHSMGCSVIWCYLDTFGTDRVASLVLVDQAASQLVQPWWSAQERLDFGCSQTPQELFEFCGRLSGPDGEDFTRSMFSSIFTSRFPQDDLDWVLSEILRMPRRHAAELFLDHAQRDWRDVIRNIRLPTLVIGARKSVFPAQSQEWIASQIPGSEVVIFEEPDGGSHFMCMENPVRFNEVVRMHDQWLSSSQG